MELRRGLMMGMAESAIKLLKVGSYTVEESWENDTKGNADTVFKTVVSPYLDEKPSLYFLLFVGNNASNATYRCDNMVVVANATASNVVVNGNYAGGAVRYNKKQYRNIALNASTWASAGTVIEIYKADLSAY